MKCHCGGVIVGGEGYRRCTACGETTTLVVPEGRLALAVSLNVTASEMAAWSPERVRRFFTGVAQAMAARLGEERNGLPAHIPPEAPQ